MIRQLSRIGRRFVFGLIGVLILLGVFIIQNPEVRENLPIIGTDTCGEVAGWDAESKPYRPDIIIRLGEFGEWEEWTDADYEQVIGEIDGYLAWFEENPAPEDAQSAQENYVTNLEAIREILEASQNGEFETEAALSNALNPHNLLLNDPATDFVALCQ